MPQKFHPVTALAQSPGFCDPISSASHVILDWENYKQKKKPSKKPKQSQSTTKKDDLSVTTSLSISAWSRDRIISTSILIRKEGRWVAHSSHPSVAVLKYCWYTFPGCLPGVRNVPCVFSLWLPLFSLYCSKNLPVFEIFKGAPFGFIGSLSLSRLFHWFPLFSVSILCLIWI